MERYRNKYRIQSSRLRNWDYGRDAAYFVTICTSGRKCFFGKIIVGEMELSEIGKLVNKFWHDIPNHFPFVILDAFVVMPNHLHGIIIINKHHVETPNLGVSTGVSNLFITETPNLGVSAGVLNNNIIKGNQVMNTTMNGKNQKWKQETLGVILNQFKRICTINVKKINRNFAWQPRYHDHIIRDQNSYIKIRDYINNNPAKWKDDKLRSI